jgi:superfamily II DNA or RNA helicase
VPTLTLLHQTSKDLSDLLEEPVGKIGDSTYSVKRVTVATIDSLKSGLKREEVKTYLNSVKVWLIDESHLSAADSYRDVSELLVNTEYRFGLSATVRRGDGNELVFHGIIGPLVKRLTPIELIDAGWLARPRIEMHVIEHEYIQEGIKKPSYSSIYKTNIVNNVERNNYVMEQCYRAKQEKRDPVLILIQDLEHGDILQDLIAQLGPCAYLKGENDQKDRTKVVQLFQKGDIPFLVASTIFDIGVDIPEIKTIILAGAGKSASRAIQRVGRGLRKPANKSINKTECLIVDFEDRCSHFLLDHSMQRKWWFNQYYPDCVTVWKNGKVLKEII